MAADFMLDSEVLPLFIAPRTVRRSRCMCLLFLFLIATFVGLAPIMVYRSLGVALPDALKGHRNVQPWMIVSQFNSVYGSPPPDETDVQAAESTQWENHETTTKPKPVAISIPKAHLHPSIPTRPSAPTTTSDSPTVTNPHPIS